MLHLARGVLFLVVGAAAIEHAVTLHDLTVVELDHACLARLGYDPSRLHAVRECHMTYDKLGQRSTRAIGFGRDPLYWHSATWLERVQPRASAIALLGVAVLAWRTRRRDLTWPALISGGLVLGIWFTTWRGAGRLDLELLDILWVAIRTLVAVQLAMLSVILLRLGRERAGPGAPVTRPRPEASPGDRGTAA